MSSIAGFLAKALVPVTVSIAFALFRKYFPAAPLAQESMHDLDQRFNRVKWVIVLAMFTVGILFAWSTYALLVLINWRLALADGPAKFILLPQKAIGGSSLCLELL